MKKNFAVLLLVFASSIAAHAQRPSNAIRISPIGVNEIGTTVGIIYEKYMTNNPKLSVSFPVDVVFRQHDLFWDNVKMTSPAYFYFTPGFKFSPGSVERPVKYGIGSHLVFGTGDRYYSVYDPGMYAREYKRSNNTRLGIMVVNSVNFDVSQTFTMGIKLGVGLLYMDKSEHRPNDIGGTIQLSTNFGFKF